MMPFEDLTAFFAMGKHGLYVWLAYGLTCIIVFSQCVLAVHKRKMALKRLKSYMNHKK